MTVAECTLRSPDKGASCGGGDDLMFWILDQGSLGTLTPQQQRVIRANPLVQ